MNATTDGNIVNLIIIGTTLLLLLYFLINILDKFVMIM